MAKKSFFEKLGLVESDEPVGAPEFENELRVCSDVGDHYINGNFPEDEQVQAEVPEGDTIDIKAVYEANSMNPADAVTVYKIRDVIDTELEKDYRAWQRAASYYDEDVIAFKEDAKHFHGFYEIGHEPEGESYDITSTLDEFEYGC